MAYILYILFLSAVVLADYFMDNTNTSIIFSMPPSQSSQYWQLYSHNAYYQQLQINNSTGNFSIVLDASNCYDQTYAQGTCGTSDDCFVQIPFTGSGITIYVFNAGTSGMTAGFSVDNGAAVSSSIAAPTSAENYQVSNVSLYDVQGLPSGNHTIIMTLMDWQGSNTVMKFDYAYVNESLVEAPITSSSIIATSTTPACTSQTPSQTSIKTTTTSDRLDAGSIVGIALGSASALGGMIIVIFWFCKRRASRQRSSAPSFAPQTESPSSEHASDTPSSSQSYSQHSLGSLLSLRSDVNSLIPPLMRSAILRDALASPSSPIQRQPVDPISNLVLQPQVRHSPSYSIDSGPLPRSNVSHVAHGEPSVLSSPMDISRLNIAPGIVEAVRGRLADDGVPSDMITLAIEAFLSHLSTGEASAGQTSRSRGRASIDLPPSYQTRERRR